MSYSADESTNSITFTIQASESSSVSFSVQFHTQNSNPLSAEGKICGSMYVATVQLNHKYVCIKLYVMQVIYVHIRM